MRKILVPTEIAPQITLYEASLWIAFNFYVESYYSLNLKEVHEEEDAYRENQLDPEYLFTEDLCDKYGLPTNYAMNYINKDDYPPYHSGSWGFYEERADSLPKDIIDGMEKEKKEYQTYVAKQKPFYDAVDDQLEVPKSRLFIFLKEGRVKAVGKKVFDANKNIPSESFVTEGTALKTDDQLLGQYLDVFNIHPEFEELQIKHWLMSAVDWQESSLKSEYAAYYHILVDTESLFEAFPAPKADMISVYSINGTYLVDDEAPIIRNTNKKGRPAYPWKEFNTEMAKRLIRRELPEQQKSCVIDMQEWCKQNWGATPSDTNLKTYISPFYAAKSESETKSENKTEKEAVTF